MALDKELLSILVCPACKGEVKLDEKRGGILCENCALLFPVKDDIPVMLVEEAQKLRD